MNEAYIITLATMLLTFLRLTVKNPGKSKVLDKWLIELRNLLLMWYPITDFTSTKVMSKRALVTETKKFRVAA